MYCFLKWIKFSVKQTNTKKILENWKKYWKSQGKVREFCQCRKVGTLIILRYTWMSLENPRNLQRLKSGILKKIKQYHFKRLKRIDQNFLKSRFNDGIFTFN